MTPSDFDWGAIDDAIDDAASATDDALAARISSLTRFTDQEVKDIFPKKADAQKLAQLMKIVKADTDHNEKVARITAGIQDLGGTLVKLVDRLT